jgi:hypothetical protein
MGPCKTQSGLLGSFLNVHQLSLISRAKNCIKMTEQAYFRQRPAYSTPATPSRTRFSAVMVPVLSKQQTSTLPAEGIRKGSVQKMAENKLDETRRIAHVNLPNFDKATREAFTARESSIGNSGGTTLVMIKTQSRSNFDFLRFRSRPWLDANQRCRTLFNCSATYL